MIDFMSNPFYSNPYEQDDDLELEIDIEEEIDIDEELEIEDDEFTFGDEILIFQKNEASLLQDERNIWKKELTRKLNEK